MFVYELSFINGDKYIGITFQKNPNNRLTNHKIFFKDKNIIFNIIDVININKEDRFLVKYWESFYISLYKSWGFKLKNKNNGGGGPLQHSEETKNNFSKIRKIKGTNNNQILPFRKKILQYDLDGNFVREWVGINNTANTLGIQKSSIYETLKGIRQSAGGYIWLYKNSEMIINDQIRNKNLCPFCLSENIKKNGKYKNDAIYRYKCKDCEKSYSDLTFIKNKYKILKLV